LRSAPARPLERTWHILQVSTHYLKAIGPPSVKEMKQTALDQLRTTAVVINLVRWQMGVRGAHPLAFLTSTRWLASTST
jgi:hypothetical protein